jgi:hypothetical protein
VDNEISPSDVQFLLSSGLLSGPQQFTVTMITAHSVSDLLETARAMKH